MTFVIRAITTQHDMIDFQTHTTSLSMIFPLIQIKTNMPWICRSQQSITDTINKEKYNQPFLEPFLEHITFLDHITKFKTAYQKSLLLPIFRLSYQ
jgi:hypothetical protein